MPVLRPCIHRTVAGVACPEYALEGKSRCLEHEQSYQRNRITPSQRITQSTQWRKLRKRLMRERRLRIGGWTCGLCGGRIVDEGDVEGHHVVEVAVAPHLAFEPSNVMLVHRSCNRRKKIDRPQRPTERLGGR